MSNAIVEHINITVNEPVQLAEQLCQLFDWQIRWQGPALNNGKTVHVGGENSYLALYRPPELTGKTIPPYTSDRAINHIGVVVDDLAFVKSKVADAGIEIYNENDIAPGSRFYFDLAGIEFEVVKY